MISNSSETNIKRGRKKLPDLWTRVVSMSCDNLTNIKGYSIATDLLVNEGIEPPKKRKNAKEWHPVFMPKMFASEMESMDLEAYALSSNNLKKYSEIVSSIRKIIRE